MPRPKRQKIKFDKNSLNNYVQEIYDDSHNIKAHLTRILNKWERYAKDQDDIATLGDSVVKLINALSKNQDQKLMLLKHIKDIVMEMDSNDKNGSGNGDRAEKLDSMIRNAIVKKSREIKDED